MTPAEKTAATVRALRIIARETCGADDDATCLNLAALMLAGETQDGFHRAAPAEIPALRLDDKRPAL